MTFFETFFILFPIVNKTYFIIRFSMTTYQNSSVLLAKGLFFDKFVAIFGKKYGSFCTKILWRFFVRIRFRLF